MNIALRTKVVDDILKKIGRDKWEEASEHIRYASPNDMREYVIEDIPDEALAVLKPLLEKGTGNSDRTAKLILSNYELLLTDHKGTFATRLEQLVSGFKNFFEDSPHKWVFLSESYDARLLPMFVQRITYYPDEWKIKNRKRYLASEAHVTMVCSYVNRRQDLVKVFKWTRSDINRDSGTTFANLLRQHNLSKETPRAFAKYEEEIARFQAISVMTGAQFAAVGVSRTASYSRYASLEFQPMIREGRPTKVVMDDFDNEGAFSRSNDRHGVSPSKSMDFWIKPIKKTLKEIANEDEADEELYDSDEEQELEQFTTLPTWPFVKVFDLTLHQFCEMHVNDVEDYQWDESVFDKLILPADHKSLIEILVNGTNDLMEDIVAGKTGGIIVMATGKPGVGKTLTAEVYSEFIKRPVYSVQCSQLGLDVNSIEKNLTSVLNRAQRWNALLLLDEADVYIRHRGHDLHHNAIVGVFLRILEYYRGVLFMTSNLATVIDDAVLSRVTAHIRYAVPDEKMRRELWEVLGNQYKCKFTKKELDALAKEFNVAGRDIKSMLKLATLIRARDPEAKVDIDLLKKVYQFQDTAETMGESPLKNQNRGGGGCMYARPVDDEVYEEEEIEVED